MSATATKKQPKVPKYESTQVTLSRKKLLEACRWAAKASTKTDVKPILQFLRFAGDGKQLTVQATNLEQAITVCMECSQDIPPFTLPAERTVQVLERSTSDTVKMEVSAEVVTFHLKNGRVALRTGDTSLFPDLSEPDGESTCKLLLVELLDLFHLVGSAVQDKSQRYAFGAINFASRAGALELQATNGRYALLAAGLAPFRGSGLVPPKALKLLEGEPDAGIEIWLTGRDFWARTETVLVYSRLIEGRFPDIHDIVVKGHKTKASTTLTAGELLEAVRQAGLVCSDDDPSVLLSFSPNGLSVETFDTTYGESKIVLEGSVQGADEVRLPVSQLTSTLKALKADDAIQIHSGGSTPFKITRGENFQAYIQPMVQ